MCGQAEPGPACTMRRPSHGHGSELAIRRIFFGRRHRHRDSCRQSCIGPDRTGPATLLSLLLRIAHRGVEHIGGLQSASAALRRGLRWPLVYQLLQLPRGTPRWPFWGPIFDPLPGHVRSCCACLTAIDLLCRSAVRDSRETHPLSHKLPLTRRHRDLRSCPARIAAGLNSRTRCEAAQHGAFASEHCTALY